ncbi:MAG: leucine-rich repeat protein, partial [Anaerotignum sp.]|nr:leucine-rich repeat protein [Anaerotignum sp.]
GNAAFQNCRKLREAVLTDTVRELGEAVFAGCSSLEQVRMPKVLERIGADLFRGCRRTGILLYWKCVLWILWTGYGAERAEWDL